MSEQRKPAKRHRWRWLHGAGICKDCGTQRKWVTPDGGWTLRVLYRVPGGEWATIKAFGNRVPACEPKP